MIIAAFLNVCWLWLHILKYCACAFHEHPNLSVGAMSLEENTINPPQIKDLFRAPDQWRRLYSQSKASPESSPLLFIKSKMKSLSPVLASLALLLVLSYTSLASTHIKCKIGIPVLSIESSMVLALQSIFKKRKFSFFSVPLWRGGLPSHHHLRPARWQRFKKKKLYPPPSKKATSF